MYAYGSDGDIAASDTHLTIYWKTLRGRLASAAGTPIEVVPISKIDEITLIPSSETQKGCLQLHLHGNTRIEGEQLNWMSHLRDGILTHVVTFTLPAQFEFNALAKHLEAKIKHNKDREYFESIRSNLGS